MDIKKLISNQKTRHKILAFFSWLPDSIMLRLQYYSILHRWPNFSNPNRFTEWIQLYKMNYRNSLLPKCVDKYEVRKFVQRKGCEKYLNRLLQVCEKAEDIDFEHLPPQFVIKSTNGGNGDNILIIKNKSSLDIDKTILEINSWLTKNYSSISREWAYCQASTKPRIIIEQLLENSEDDSELDDYKFLCFNGKFEYLWVDKNRFTDHKRGFWNNRLEFLYGIKSDHPTFENPPKLPSNIGQMIQVAETLSKEFPFVRVDLYNVSGKIIFGELTFYPWSGYVQFDKDAFDMELGALFNKVNSGLI